MGVLCVFLDVRFSVILEGYIFGAGPVFQKLGVTRSPGGNWGCGLNFSAKKSRKSENTYFRSPKRDRGFELSRVK